MEPKGREKLPRLPKGISFGTDIPVSLKYARVFWRKLTTVSFGFLNAVAKVPLPLIMTRYAYPFGANWLPKSK